MLMFFKYSKKGHECGNKEQSDGDDRTRWKQQWQQKDSRNELPAQISDSCQIQKSQGI